MLNSVLTVPLPVVAEITTSVVFLLSLGCGSYTVWLYVWLSVHTRTWREVGEGWVWSVWSSPTPPREPLGDRCGCEGKDWELKMTFFLWIRNILNFFVSHQQNLETPSQAFLGVVALHQRPERTWQTQFRWAPGWLPFCLAAAVM